MSGRQPTADSRQLRDCPDCGVKPGEIHVHGCDMEQCPICGGQFISCGCGGSTEEMEARYDAEVERLGGFLPWTGEYRGVEACRIFGFWSRRKREDEPHQPYWVRCSKDEPHASEDLNRLHGWHGVEWDKDARGWRYQGKLVPWGG